MLGSRYMKEPPKEAILVSLPAGMRARLKKRADAEHRSMNAQVVALIEEYLKQEEHA